MHFSELRIYKIAINLELAITRKLDAIKFNWKYEGVDQLIRSSSSVSANIVEGHSRKFYKRDYLKFLNYSLGSSDESQKHIKKLHMQTLLIESDYIYFSKGYKDLSIKILNYINWLRKNN